MNLAVQTYCGKWQHQHKICIQVQARLIPGPDPPLLFLMWVGSGNLMRLCPSIVLV